MVGFLLDKFTGTLMLSKTKFFGLKKYHAEILITQNLKIISVKTNIKDLPNKNGDIIDFLIIKNWAESNGYDIVLKTKNNKLKRLFYFI
jgi:hypothetical protein